MNNKRKLLSWLIPNEFAQVKHCLGKFHRNCEDANDTVASTLADIVSLSASNKKICLGYVDQHIELGIGMGKYLIMFTT